MTDILDTKPTDQPKVAKTPIKFFHELTNEEFEALKESNITWGEVAELYPQPTWCAYPGALEGEMGCWSLVFRHGVCDTYCQTCDLYKKPETGETQ